MAVKITGTILASLLYDNSSCDGDQSGFLLGEIVRDVKDTISDSQINNVEVETKIYVYDSVPCPRDQIFYNRRGDAQMEKISTLLRGKTQTIVGWYSFRRNTTLRPTYRERLVHNSLVQALSLDVNTFTFLLCSEKSKTNQSTHVFDHCFLHQHDSGFRKFPVTIVNLGDTTHTEYKCSPSHTVSNKQGLFNAIVQQQEEGFLNAHGQMEVKHIQSLNGAISRQLERISYTLAESEVTVSELEDEVGKLREKARRKQLENQHLKMVQARQREKEKETVERQKEKQPSVDELLFMDEDEHVHVALPVGQGHSLIGQCQPERSGGQQVSETSSSSESAMETESPVKTHSQVTNKAKMTLTTPVVLHSRSRSNPVETATVTSQPTIIHSRSRSGDVNSEASKNMAKSVGAKKPADPFAFVGEEMMASSKKMDSPGSSNNASDRVTMATGPSGHKGLANHNKLPSKESGAAAVTVARKLSGHGQSTKGQGQKALNDLEKGHGHKHEPKGACNPLYEHKISKGKEFSSSGKNCAQEASKQGEVMTDEDSSQDTYEMDVSSSPVY